MATPITYYCPACNRRRRPVRNEHIKRDKCLRCSLVGTPLLRRLFGEITVTDDMKQFTAHIEKWYLDA